MTSGPLRAPTMMALKVKLRAAMGLPDRRSNTGADLTAMRDRWTISVDHASGAFVAVEKPEFAAGPSPEDHVMTGDDAMPAPLADLLSPAEIQTRIRNALLPGGLPAGVSNISATVEARVSCDIALGDALSIKVHVQAGDAVFTDALIWSSTDPKPKAFDRDRMFRAYARLYVPFIDPQYGELNLYEHVGVRLHNYDWLRHCGRVTQTTAELDEILFGSAHDVPESWLSGDEVDRDYDMSQDHVLWLGAQLAAGTCDLTQMRLVADDGAIFDGAGRLLWMSPQLDLTTWRDDIVATYGLSGAAAIVDAAVIASHVRTLGLPKDKLHPKNTARLHDALADPDATRRPTVYVDGDPDTFAAALAEADLDLDPFVVPGDASRIVWSMLQRVAAARGIHPLSGPPTAPAAL